MYAVRQRRGLGDLTSDCAALTTWNYWLHPSCWSYSIPQWQDRNQLPRPPMPAPPPAVPAGLSTEPMPVTVPEAQAQIDASLNQQMVTTQAQNQDFFNQYPMGLLADQTGGGLNTSTLIALGLGAGVLALMFTSGSSRRRR